MTNKEIKIAVDAVIEAWRKGRLGLPFANEALGRELSPEEVETVWREADNLWNGVKRWKSQS